MKYDSCDFMVALPESDVGGFTVPANVIPDLASRLKVTKWKEKGEDYKTQLNIPAIDSKTDEALIFRKDDE